MNTVVIVVMIMMMTDGQKGRVNECEARMIETKCVSTEVGGRAAMMHDEIDDDHDNNNDSRLRFVMISRN